VATPQQPRRRTMSRTPRKTPSYGSIDPGERWEQDNNANEATNLISTTPSPSYPSSLAARFDSGWLDAALLWEPIRDPLHRVSSRYTTTTRRSLLVQARIPQKSVATSAPQLNANCSLVALYIHMWTIIRMKLYPFSDLELTQSSMRDPDGLSIHPPNP
ncbi:7271_t:CDS:2, partial [Acaulospora colombiana]